MDALYMFIQNISPHFFSKSNLFWISDEKITYKLDFLSPMYVYERETNNSVPNQMNRTKKLFMFTNLFAYHY